MAVVVKLIKGKFNVLEPDPSKIIKEQVTEKSVKSVNIGRIDIDFMSGKKAKEVIISL